jgi:hypothetical protein
MGSSSTNYTNTGASEKGTSIANSNVNLAQDQAVNLGSGATMRIGTTMGNIGDSSTVTIGEVGLGQTFADTVKAMTESNTAALGELLKNNSASVNNLPSADTLPVASVAAADGDGATGLGEIDWKLWATIAGGAALLFWFFRR